MPACLSLSLRFTLQQEQQRDGRGIAACLTPISSTCNNTDRHTRSAYADFTHDCPVCPSVTSQVLPGCQFNEMMLRKSYGITHPQKPGGDHTADEAGSALNAGLLPTCLHRLVTSPGVRIRWISRAVYLMTTPLAETDPPLFAKRAMYTPAGNPAVFQTIVWSPPESSPR